MPPHAQKTLMRRGRVIARIWHGWAPQATADDYQRHFGTQVRAHLQGVDGFLGARLLRRVDGAEVMFTSITWFTSLDAVRGFAGADYEQAVVEDAGNCGVRCQCRCLTY
jgi:heme-degrading monooxygenase HmoA